MAAELELGLDLDHVSIPKSADEAVSEDRGARGVTRLWSTRPSLG